jgi:small-conductance mechanosensitive channel
MHNLEYVEQELSELRQRLTQSVDMLDSLSNVQEEFENLARTHQLLRANVEESQTAGLEQLQSTIEERFAAVESRLETLDLERLKEALREYLTDIETRLDSITPDIIKAIADERCAALEQRFSATALTQNHLNQLQHEVGQRIATLERKLPSNGNGQVPDAVAQRLTLLERRAEVDHLKEFSDVIDERFGTMDKRVESFQREFLTSLNNIRDEFTSADRGISLNLSQQLDQLIQELDGQLTNLQQEWAKPQEALKAHADAIESRLREEMQMGLSPRMPQELDPSVFIERLNSLEMRSQKVKGTLQSLDRRMKFMTAWVPLITLISMAALALPFIPSAPN